MKAKITDNALNKYSELFGSEIYKNTPLFAYAEHLFFCGMNQMVPTYEGGVFDFFEIIESDVEIEKSGFFPLIKNKKEVLIATPFGQAAKVSFQAASLIVWLICIEQIANGIGNLEVRKRLYNTIQDLKHCYSELFNEDGNKIFSENDCKYIYKLLD